jgi:signal transduction histidine kinase
VLEGLPKSSGEMLTIMITAYASIETAVQAIKRGAYDFLAKPFTPEELRNTVHKAAVRLVLAKQARKLAEERNEVRLQLMRMLSHELQAPLNAVDGYLELMRQHIAEGRPEALAPLINRGQHRLQGMRDLIRNLLDMTQIESSRRRRNLLPVDVREAARSALEVFHLQARERGIVCALHANRPIAMRADRSELDMIFHNLLSNAIKYNHPQGEIHITLDRNTDTVSISVADSGIGIAAEDLPQLFREFVRIRNETTRDIPGNGLGLSIVAKIARLYQGEVLVDSEPGRGSKFTVLLQDAPRSALAAPPADALLRA